MKSDRNVVRDILKAQGLPWDTEPARGCASSRKPDGLPSPATCKPSGLLGAHAPSAPATDEALKVLREYGQAKYREGDEDASYDAQF